MAALLPPSFLAPPGHFNVARYGVVPRPIKTIAAITPALVTSYAQHIELAEANSAVLPLDSALTDHGNQTPLSAFWCGSTAGGRVMWLYIWVITLTSAISLAVIAMAVLPKDQRATFGG